MYAVRLWSVRHASGLNAFYRAFEKALIALHPLWNKIGYEKLEKPFEERREGDQGLPVRLPDVRAMRPLLHRHVVPDELPEEPAQRPVRRRARQRALRGEAGDEVRVGAGLGRRRPHGPQGRGRPQDPATCSARSTTASRASRPGCGWCASPPAWKTRPATSRSRRPPSPARPRTWPPSPPPCRPRRRAKRHERDCRMNDGHGHFDPSAPLPLLPGHSSGGRLERVLRLGALRGHGRAEPAGQRRSARRL